MEELSLTEKIGLLTGADAFTLPALPRIGLRGLRTSDGPAGVRGTNMDPEDRSTSFPAPIALAATWDPALVERVTAQLGIESRAKGIDVLLAPTVNLARTPYGGRGFECFGEDPVLAARIAAAYVRGVQGEGVATTVKHFVGNDSEVERWTVDVQADEATLREVYLVPFEACVTDADAAAVMAGYNKVNGLSMTEHEELIAGILKQEWGFQGAVFSDWSAARSTVETALAGLDLVMPGPDGPWGQALVDAVKAGLVPEELIDDKVARLLRMAELCGALGAPGDPAPALTVHKGPHADRAVVRGAAARSFTLLRNVSSALPLPTDIRELALIGPNAVHPVYQGGGSAEVGPAVIVSPLEGLRTALGEDVNITLAEGCAHSYRTSGPDPESTEDPLHGGPGARLDVYDSADGLVYSGIRPNSELTFWDPLPAGVAQSAAKLVLSTIYTVPADGGYRFAVAGVGELRLEIDGETAAEAIAPPPNDPMEVFSQPFESGCERDLRAGDRVRLTATGRPGDYEPGFVRFRLAAQRIRTAPELMGEALAAAGEADAVVLVVGPAPGEESEGYDRTTLALPGRQDALIEEVAAVCPRTIVVVNSGMPVLMPWAERVSAIIQVWFPGQEFGHALADVLTGAQEPTGRLPVSIPRTEPLVPVGIAKPQDGALRYAEGLSVGYRAYARTGIDPRYPFGHGLGYTEWEYEEVQLPVGPMHAGADVEIGVTVRNVGERPGTETVQVYLTRPIDGVSALAAFGQAVAEPGERTRVRLTLPARAFAHWDSAEHAWAQPGGTFVVKVGPSSRELPLRGELLVG
ncbi:MAG TPA: glycoside hydrolase family 3 C-terminal domain-containing protein [Actinospica sp.]|nr:glycoside hydrolase family 3 C-terminal domain-containing protein [Actinospica sp.]